MPVPAGLLGFLNGSIWIPVTGGLTDFEASTAATGYLLPADCLSPVVIDGGVYYYFVRNTANTQWEFGAGVWDAGTDTLARSFVFQSSSGTSKIDFVSAPTIEMGAPFAQLMALAPQAVTITYTGTFTGGEPPLLLISPQVVQIGFASTLLDFKGPWLQKFGEKQGGTDTTLLTITAVNLVGAVDVTLNDFSALTSISLSELRIVTNGLNLGGSSLTTFDAPKLIYAAGVGLSDTPLFDAMSLPLAYIGTSGINVSGNLLLEEVSLPNLVQDYGAFSLSSLPVFTTLDLPLVEQMGALSLSSLDVLQELSIPKVTAIYGDIQLVNCQLLDTVDLPLLETVGGIFINDD